jgi:hypothetical protein
VETGGTLLIPAGTGMWSSLHLTGHLAYLVLLFENLSHLVSALATVSPPRMPQALFFLALLATAQAQFSLFKLSLSAHPMATCLDGTPGGFYLQQGSGTGLNKWVIHTQGGGEWLPKQHNALSSCRLV